MGMTREEVLVKLNMDASQLDEQTKKSMAQLANAGKEQHKWWQHAGNAGREFHKILERVSDIVPGLGNVFKLAISPIVGWLSLAGYALTGLVEGIKDARREAKEAEAEAEAAERKTLEMTGGGPDRRRAVRLEEANRRRERGYDVSKEEAARLAEMSGKEQAIKKLESDTEEAKKELLKMEEKKKEAQKYIEENDPRYATYANIGPRQQIIDEYEKLSRTIASNTIEINRRRDALQNMRIADADASEAAREFERIASANADAAIARAKDIASRPEPSIGGPGDAGVLGDRSGRNFVSGALSDDQLRDPDLVGAIDASTGGYALRRILGKEGLAANGGIKYNPLSGSADWLRKHLQKPQAPSQTAEQLLGQVIDKLSNPLTVQGKD